MRDNIPPYGPYVDHMLRRYYLGKLPRNHVESLNYKLTEDTVQMESPENLELLYFVYTSREKVTECVHKFAEKSDIPIPVVWRMLEGCQRRLAKARGLIA